MATPRFEALSGRRQREAVSASLPGFKTVSQRAALAALQPIGNPWSRQLFDGDFYRRRAAVPGLPAVSLVFVQSRDGNTGADNPQTLGGGETDKHLIYEGLSRIEADAVLAGATTARGKDMVFSVWHPQLVALRHELGMPRHPAQIVVTDRADLGVDEALMFQEPELRTFVITRSPIGYVMFRDQISESISGSEVTCLAREGHIRWLDAASRARHGEGGGMRGNDRVIAQLNEALREELTAVNQYFLHAEMCHSWGYHKLGSYIKKQSIDEMKHAEKLIERILFLDATPKMEYLDLKIGQSVRAQIEADLELEVNAVAMYNKSIAISREVGDDQSRELFSTLLKDEEEHVDWLEAQVHQIKEMGYERYLSNQTDGPKD